LQHYPKSYLYQAFSKMVLAMSQELLGRGEKWLGSLLELCQMPASVKGQVRSDALESGLNYWLTIESSEFSLEQIQALIGEGGSAIDAIQSLANATLNRDQESDAHIYYTIEISSYREQRLQKLREIGLQAFCRSPPATPFFEGVSRN
jgi:spoIIIJ-associated protein